jgi:hypothetical protein
VVVAKSNWPVQAIAQTKSIGTVEVNQTDCRLRHHHAESLLTRFRRKILVSRTKLGQDSYPVHHSDTETYGFAGVYRGDERD